MQLLFFFYVCARYNTIIVRRRNIYHYSLIMSLLLLAADGTMTLPPRFVEIAAAVSRTQDAAAVTPSASYCSHCRTAHTHTRHVIIHGSLARRVYNFVPVQCCARPSLKTRKGKYCSTFRAHPSPRPIQFHPLCNAAGLGRPQHPTPVTYIYSVPTHGKQAGN